jgi:DNA-binding SARP family transcriptional activator
MASSVEFGVLGPLLVRVDGDSVAIPRGKQRTLLAVLLLRAGLTVAADQLADMLWDPEPPPRSAAVTLQNYVKRLRQALGPTGRDRIVTQPHGYLIRVEPGELDLAVMEHALTAARKAARESAWEHVADEALAALSLWRGEALSDVQLPQLAAPEISRLAELRLQAAELRAEAELGLARHAEAVTDLEQLAATAPLREHLQALLMLALYRCDRRAEALAAYQRTRDLLVSELGSEPGPELQKLYGQILRDDLALASSPGMAEAVMAEGPAVEAIRQLPAAVSSFTGREAELAQLAGLLGLDPHDQAPALVISAIGGTAGVGKTALAVQWAHQVAERFPDGQLYVNLRGYDPDQPVTAANALAGFLRALGVPGQEIPDGVDERSGLYRSRLAGRRVLVVLDNARDSDQVRPLLPGGPACAAVVTSRDQLAGLVAADGARRLDLNVLPLDDAVALLQSLIGGRADEEPLAVLDLAALCARLPLALRIAAELAATRSEVSLRELVTELQESQLDALDAGEDRANVRAVFSWSVRQLPDDAARAFALTGLHPGADFDLYAAAALTGTSPAQARRILPRLQRASLLQAAGPGRYGLHDLLRAYAREQVAARDTDGSSQSALTRLFDYYLAAAAAAMNIAFPAEASYLPRALASTSVVPRMPGEADAREWLDNERANLVAIVVHCADNGWLRYAADLATTLSRYLIDGSHVSEGQTIYGHALRAARRSGDLPAEADALSGLGGMSLRTGHVRDAVAHYKAALGRYRECALRLGEAETLHNLGVTQYQLHDGRAAADYFREAVTAWQDAGDSLGAARTLTLLAAAEIGMDLHDDAAQHLHLALAVVRDAKDQTFEASALGWLGELTSRCGRLAEATAFHEQALAIYRRIEHPSGICTELNSLGQISLRQEEYQQAIGYLEQGLDLCRQAGNQFEELMTLRKLAEALHGVGQPAAARAELEAALRLAAETGNSYQHACAHRDIAENYLAAGEETQARRHWQQALNLYTELGAPEADQVSSRMSEVHAGSAG